MRLTAQEVTLPLALFRPRQHHSEMDWLYVGRAIGPTRELTGLDSEESVECLEGGVLYLIHKVPIQNLSAIKAK